MEELYQYKLFVLDRYQCNTSNNFVLYLFASKKNSDKKKEIIAYVWF